MLPALQREIIKASFWYDVELDGLGSYFGISEERALAEFKCALIALRRMCNLDVRFSRNRSQELLAA